MTDQVEIPAEYRDREATPEECALHGGQLSDQKPIAITVGAEEIGTMYAARLQPDAYGQYLMERFKAAGAPVEGSLRLRLAHGQIYKLKSKPGDMDMQYLWLSEAYVQGLAQIGGVA